MYPEGETPPHKWKGEAMKTNSLQRLFQIRREVKALSLDALKSAVVVEGIGTDDQILGSLFKSAALGIVDADAYSVVYETTNSLGVFKSRQDRLAAGRLAQEFKSRR
jgi:hypothetical protein